MSRRETRGEVIFFLWFLWEDTIKWTHHHFPKVTCALILNKGNLCHYLSPGTLFHSLEPTYEASIPPVVSAEGGGVADLLGSCPHPSVVAEHWKPIALHNNPCEGSNPHLSWSCLSFGALLTQWHPMRWQKCHWLMSASCTMQAAFMEESSEESVSFSEDAFDVGSNYF